MGPTPGHSGSAGGGPSDRGGAGRTPGTSVGARIAAQVYTPDFDAARPPHVRAPVSSALPPSCGADHDRARRRSPRGGVGRIHGSSAATPTGSRRAIPSGENYQELKALLAGLSLNTVCEEAHCPNIGECWDQRTATIMILGDTCTRACGFCAVKTGRPTWNDDDEPRRVAEARPRRWASSTSCHERRPRRPARRRRAHLRRDDPAAPARVPGHGRRGADPRLQRRPDGRCAR